MKRAKLLVVAVLAFGLLTIAPAPASAERFADFYLGVADTREKVNRAGRARGFAEGTSSSFTLGGRIGSWFDGAPSLALALDASVFEAEDDVTVIPLSALLMLRLQLQTSEEFPKGQIQPYVGIGPGLFISEADTDGFSDTTTDIGLDLRVGIGFLLRKNLGIFGEYRFTHVEPDFKDRGITVETEDDTHHILVGLSFRF